MNRVSLVVSSVGRPACLPILWDRILTQTQPPHCAVFAVTSPNDVPESWRELIDEKNSHQRSDLPKVILAPKGLTSQRNAGMKYVLEDSDIIAFFDDDFIPSKHAISGIASAFNNFPELSGLTGRLLADGIKGPGIEPAEAVKMMLTWDTSVESANCAANPRNLGKMRGLYGCNMAFRVSSIGSVRFDERLPLYGWLEDIDFSFRIPGLKISTDGMVGVHCGVKHGREVRGEMLGYSQIANPYYLWRKGSIPASFGLKFCLRNMFSNHTKVFRPEPWVDRKGRMLGNWLALRDIALSKVKPEKILNLR